MINKKQSDLKTQKPKIKVIKKEALEKESYSVKDIYVLEGLEPVRKRPGMYIGSTGSEGLHHLIWECVDNALDEAMAGYAKNIEIILLPDSKVKVIDDGRGIPIEIHPQTGKSALETIMTTLHAGAKFGGKAYQVAGGLHGVGVSVVCALSQWMRAEICWKGFRYFQEYSKGKTLTKVKKEESCQKSGTSVIFQPDSEIFKETTRFELKKILRHLRQQSYLTPKIKITIRDQRTSPFFVYNFYFEGGLKSYIKYLLNDAEFLHENTFFVKGEKDGIQVEAAFQYAKDIESLEESFANNIFNGEGGTHFTGFRTALTRTLNDYARKNGFLKEKDENLTGNDVREGLISVVSIKIKEPQFEGQTKSKLGNPEVRSVVDNVVSEALNAFLEKNPQDARAIIENCLLSFKARQAAQSARLAVLRKSVLEGLTLPGKLADCSLRKTEDSELYIVEGDSAGGSAKQARNRKFQAILPLRGKILNVERTRLDKLLDSKEIKSLVIALGTAIAEDFDLKKLRYHRIIIMADADCDGNHIRTLLLTLFYRYFKSLIEAGHLYLAQPPLYKIQSGKKVEYVYTEIQKEKFLSSYREVSKKEFKKQEFEKPKSFSIQRYKGLGEMNPQELWETTMNPLNRILLKITIEDAKEADHIFDTLMGKNVLPRKKFIQAYAQKVRNLDI